MIKKILLEISGMHCDACVQIIKEELEEVKGIFHVEIDLNTNSGIVYADEVVYPDVILEAVDKAGYRAKITGITNIKDDEIPIKANLNQNFENSELKGCLVASDAVEDILKKERINANSRISLSLSGMHCTSCAAIIEKSLRKLPGIKTANVNFAAEKAIVLYDSKQINIEKIINTIKGAGYKAEVFNELDREFESRKREKEIADYRIRFLASLILSLPMLYFMLLDFFKWLPGGLLLPPYFGIISLILATPVQFVIGAGFYKGTWASLRMKTFNMDSLIAIGTSVAYFYSLANFLTYAASNNSVFGLMGGKIPELYFETSAFLITFVLLGKWLETKA